MTRLRRNWVPALVLVLGAAVTVGAVLIVSASYRSNERRLLKLRAKDVASVLTAALPSVQTPLASAAAIADGPAGVGRFERFIAGYVGRGPTHQFVSVSLWRASAVGHGPVATVGQAPVLADAPARASALFRSAARAPRLNVIGPLGAARLRLGYAFTTSPRNPYVAYAESSLPPSRRSPVQRDAAFSDLNYALYIGRRLLPQNLLLTSVGHPPLTGRVAEAIVPFGNASLTVEVSARGPLSGSLSHRLPLIAAIAGALLTVLATATSVRLVGRRRQAELRAAEQRDIAEELQHALLPETLPQLPGLEVAGRYRAGGHGLEVGGDWYDLLVLDSSRVLLVVGDVSGRGLRAAAMMATLRFAIQAYAAQGDLPEKFLPKLSRLVSVRTNGYMATVLCAVVDLHAREVSVTSAGHLPPLLVGDDGPAFVEVQAGLPVGVDQDSVYPVVTVPVPPAGTLVAFTDGLVERRGEDIDLGLERLRELLGGHRASLDELLDLAVEGLREGANDDTAIAGVRWGSPRVI